MASLSLVFVAICSLYLAPVHATGFSWERCPSNGAIVVETIAVTPDPVELPGVMKLTVRGNTTRPIDNAMLELTLHRDTFLLSVPIPCLLHLGSCSYNLCTVVDQMIAENWGTITTGLATQIKTMFLSTGINPSACPIQVSSLNLEQYVINLPSVPSVLTWLASGDYTVKAEVKDKTTGEDLMCLNLKLSLTKSSECTGWLCGRRKRDVLKNEN